MAGLHDQGGSGDRRLLVPERYADLEPGGRYGEALQLRRAPRLRVHHRQPREGRPPSPQAVESPKPLTDRRSVPTMETKPPRPSKPAFQGSQRDSVQRVASAVVRALPDRNAAHELLRAITRQMDEHSRTLHGKLTAEIDKLRGELLAEIERLIEQKLGAALPDLMRPTDEDAVAEEAKHSYLSFRGEGRHVKVPNPFDDPTTFTIALWARPSTIDRGGARGLVGNSDDEHAMPGLWLHPVERALHYDSSATTCQRYQDSLEGFFEDDAWVHVAWVKRARIYEFYKNSELIATRPAPKAVASVGCDYWIGRCVEPW